MGLASQMLEIQEPGALAKPLIGLLQGDDIRADLADDLGDTPRIEPAVGAHAFVNVVGGDDDIATAHGRVAIDHGRPPFPDRGHDARGKTALRSCHAAPCCCRIMLKAADHCHRKSRYCGHCSLSSIRYRLRLPQPRPAQ
ncbi:hypothetical protein AB7M37_002277 [Sinorhizobium fredii]